jgi:hypothetical protein
VLLLFVFLTFPPRIEGQQDPKGPEACALAWRYQAGEKRELSWKGRLVVDTKVDGTPIPGTDGTYQLKATLTIAEVDADGSATGQLQYHFLRVKGLFQGEARDDLVEGGKLKRPEGAAPEEARKKLESLLMPAKVRLSRRGQFEPDPKHPMFAYYDQLWPTMGPILPANKKPVPVGQAWIAQFQSSSMRAAGDAPVDVEYSFPDLVTKDNRRYAHITLNTSKPFRMGGADLTLTVKGDALFDPERGECIHDHASGEIGGSTLLQGRKYVMKCAFNLEFDTIPAKE